MSGILLNGSRTLSGVRCMCLLAYLFGFAAMALAASEWTDRGEYDLVLSIRSEGSPQKRLDLLDAWTKKYPATEQRFARLELYLSTYQSMSDKLGMLDIARKMFLDQPANPIGIFWCTILTPESPTTSPDILDMGEKAAVRLLIGLDKYFAANAKPETATPAEWQKQRSSAEFAAHRTLGWIAWQRRKYPEAEKEFALCLQTAPEEAEISAWLGIVTGFDKNRPIPAIWTLSRALRPNQGHPLPEERRREVNGLLERVYASYHGSADDIDKFRDASVASAAPPPDFKLDSATMIAARRLEQLLSLTNPELAAWMGIRRTLESPDGDKYFAEMLRPNPLPKMRGTVMHCSPANAPLEVTLSMTEAGTEDVVLKLKSPLPVDAPPGTAIAFQGSADTFQRSPFQLIVLTEQEKLEGWPSKPVSKYRKK